MIFQKLNNSNNSTDPGKPRRRRGQVILVILLVAAFAFILYSAILNLSKISQTKSTVTIASNVTAAHLGSFMASYGESIFRTSLGGRSQRCGWTGILAAILILIIIVVAVILAWPSGGSSLLVAAQMIALVSAVVFAVIGLVFTIVAEYGLTNTFNKLLGKQLGPLDLIVEQGVSQGLNNVVSDSRVMEDKFDLDQDGKYGNSGGNPKDTIGRYHLHYLERLKKLTPRDLDLSFFFDALKDFVYFEGDNWALHDPYPVTHPCGEVSNQSSPNKPSVCDQCCVPISVHEAGEIDPVPVRPPCCNSVDPNIPNCGWTGTGNTACGFREGTFQGGFAWADPFQEPLNPTPYKWLYQKFNENDQNNTGATPILSFREKLGWDDESVPFVKLSGAPNGVQDYVPNVIFQHQDITGYYDNDRRRGIYSPFYRLYDWRVFLRNTASAYHSLGCHWCDPDLYSVQNPHPLNPPPYAPGNPPEYDLDPCLNPNPAILELPRLQLPDPVVVDPQNPASPVIYPTYLSGSACVDGAIADVGRKAITPDRILMPNRSFGPGQGQVLTGGIAPECADDANTKPLWKRGLDNYCQTDLSPNSPVTGISEGWPYGGRCAKQLQCGGGIGSLAVANCVCSEGNDPTKWPDDTMDDIVKGIPDFLEWAVSILNAWDTDRNGTTENFPVWYPQAAEWLENIGGFSGLTERGVLREWLNTLTQWRDLLETWLDATYVGADETDVWCIPNLANSSPTGPIFMPNREEQFIENQCLAIAADANPLQFDAGGAPIPPNFCDAGQPHGPEAPASNIDKIVSCLNWNINDPVPPTPLWQGKKGNWEKFETCKRHPLVSCPQYWSTVCHPRFLPRSTVPATALGNFPRPYNQGIEPFAAPSVWMQQAAYCLEGRPFALPPTYGKCTNAQCGQVINNVAPFNGVPPPPLYNPSWGPWPANNSWCNTPGPPPAYAQCQPPTCLADGTAPGGWGPGNWRYVEILYVMGQKYQADGGSCADLAKYVPFLIDSENASRNQVAKFKKRYEYLKGRPGGPGVGWRGIVDLIKDDVKVLEEAEGRFSDFLIGNPGDPNDSPAEWLEMMMREWGPTAPPLPSEAIYAWQGEPPRRAFGERAGRTSDFQKGYWHVVRVDVRVPQRCRGPAPMEPASCNANQDLGGDTLWPRIRTKTKSWGLRRCYFLEDKRGTVKARVTRYDEDKDAGSITLPMGETIWKPRFSNPNVLPPGGIINNLIENSCGALMDLGNFPIADERALMINKKTENEPCWNLLNGLLQKGNYSETCAEYYFRDMNNPSDPPSNGFYFKFVPCRNFD